MHSSPFPLEYWLVSRRKFQVGVACIAKVVELFPLRTSKVGLRGVKNQAYIGLTCPELGYFFLLTIFVHYFGLQMT
ncbi:hypothetical protein DUNSADRAFT_17528 [Dunaliella salina]|uniref:Encoded protein n=1 Tax=Dunaliella salina TaxID=3046 RepID=A0ABQ7FWE4_DUNSA|nr:hypothetical protein DUNSADRAFT_17528 [Dunaliella salina]|eukprot:KAF5840181.1 hypothetical protein DUNSADRAFT_17528 [Dunaliella salina]